MPILYVGMVFAAFAAGFHSLDRLSRSLPRNPVKERPTSAVPAARPGAALPEAAPSEATLSEIRNALEKQEYHISYDAQKKKLQSPNRRNNIRAYYEPGKLTVQTRVDTTGGGFKMELVNEGVFADGKLLYAPAISAKAAHHENKVQISHDAFTEEFINNEDGVRQNFIIESAPEGTRQLQVKMIAKGLKVEQSSVNELRFYSEDSDGKTRNELVYNDLQCWDANKKPLNASLAYVNSRIQISVDVAQAAYPVTIDPIIANGTPQNANKILEINQSTMWLGFSVSSAGDVNGDGYSDVIVGAPQYDLGQDNEGAAFVYKGDPSGLTLTAITLEIDQADAKMGYSVASAGDFNGDGYSDILVGSYAFDHGQTDEGSVFVYHGSAGSVSTISKAVSHSTVSGALAGSSVSNAGDLNGDGLDDVIVGAPNYDGGQVGEGATFTSYGDATTGTNSMQKFETNELNAHVGCSVSGAGDVNGDGFDDVIIGASGAQNGVAKGAAYIFHGGSQGLVSAVSKTLFEGNQGFGTAVSNAGDINRDGYDDVIVGAPLYSKSNPAINLCGAVFVYLGSGNGLVTPGTAVTSGLAGTQIGNSLDHAGDTNGDGYSDIVVGAKMASIGQNSEGVVFIWHGSSSGLPSNTVFSKLLELDQANAEMGNSVAGAGDINGDGYSDIIIGAHKYDNGQADEGIAAIYYGSSTGIVSQIKSILEANQQNAYFGRSVGGAVDVNGDGYDDVVVGAPEFDGQSANGGGVWVFHGSMNGISMASNFSVSGAQAESHMGESVSGAGDLNGDGYDDILVGLPGYDQSGAANGGVSWAYFGNDGYAGKAKKSNLRLYNDDLTTIMNHGQDDEEDFGLGLAVTSFLGRNNGRLAWDLAKYGESFSKLANTPITNSTLTDGYENSFSSLSLVGGNMDLKEVINKPLPTYAALRVRGRIKYELATALTGQVFGPWRYLPGYVIYAPPISPNRENGAEEFEIQAGHNLKSEYKDLVSVYPNPVSDRLFIQSTNMDQITSLQLISANGTMAFTSTKPQSNVDVKHLAVGSYILVINRKDGSKTSHKVLIRK